MADITVSFSECVINLNAYYYCEAVAYFVGKKKMNVNVNLSTGFGK